MYSLQIVDSEPLCIAGLQAMINTEVVDIKLHPPAMMAKEALCSIIANSPDIVIINTKLADSSGIDLVRRIHDIDGPEPLIIMIAPDCDFSQIQEALRENVFDYLVKCEITQLTLNKALIRAVEYMDQFHTTQGRPVPYNGHQLMTRLFYIRLLISDDFPEEPEDVMRQLGIDFSYSFYSVIYFDTLQKLAINKDEAESMQRFIVALLQKTLSANHICQAMPWSTNGYVVILASSDKISTAKKGLKDEIMGLLKLINDKFSAGFTAGIGSDVNDPKDIRSSFLRSQSAFSYTTDHEPVIFYEQISDSCSLDVPLFIRQWAVAIDEEDEEQLDRLIAQVEQTFTRSEFHLRSVLIMCSDILHLCMNKMEGLTKSILSEYPNLPCPTLTIPPLKKPDDVLDWFHMLKKHIVYRFGEKGKEKKQIFVEAMKNYIAEHWDEPLSLRSIAERFHFSTSYVSRLFKQCNNCGFSDFITITKIEHAKELLLMPNATVNSVAERLGYDDPYYFSKVFKKYNRISPREFMIHQYMAKEARKKLSS